MHKNQLALEAIKEGKWEEAAKYFAEALEENPNDPVLYVNFGNLLASSGDAERALKFYEKAIEIDKGTATAYYGIGTVHYNAGDYP